jgi:hypothetical protein
VIEIVGNSILTIIKKYLDGKNYPVGKNVTYPAGTGFMTYRLCAQFQSGYIFPIEIC